MERRKQGERPFLRSSVIYIVRFPSECKLADKEMLSEQRRETGKVTQFTEEWNTDRRNHPWCSTSEIYFVCSLPAWLLPDLRLLYLFSPTLPQHHKVSSATLLCFLINSAFAQTLLCANYFILKMILYIIWEFSEGAVTYILVPRQNNIFWLKQDMINFRTESCPPSAVWQMTFTSRVTRLHVD